MNFSQYIAATIMFGMTVSGIFLAGVLWERYMRPAPMLVEYCPLPRGLQLSCEPQDRAEYEQVCRARARGELIDKLPTKRAPPKRG